MVHNLGHRLPAEQAAWFARGGQRRGSDSVNTGNLKKIHILACPEKTITMIYSLVNKPLFFLTVLSVVVLSSISGQPPSHDPSHMVKDGGRYYIYTTGDGIWNMSADNPNFTGWRAEALVFEQGTWPGWINGYVPGFNGFFWAPEIIYMNSKWHLYYSCSTFGSQRSAIGLVTSASLSDPDWADQGMVVYSDNPDLSLEVNAIDPDIFKDKDGKVWLLYGSYWNGIVITELDSTSGKPVDPKNLYHAAGNGCEAGNLLSHGDYYYLFFNRGDCCKGIHSTYYILTGRSGSPTGPFLDKNGIATNSGGGTVFLHSDGRFIGPGHFGYGEGKLTYHYYDGVNNGAPKLKIAEMEWGEDGWPVAKYSRSYSINDDTYTIKNVNSIKVLELAGADTAAGTNVVQGTGSGGASQAWNVTDAGNGYFRISPYPAPGKSLEVANCSKSNGANVQIGDSQDKECQKWFSAYIGSGVHIIMAAHSHQTLEVVNAYTHDGANVQQWPYNEHPTQRWTLAEPLRTEAAGIESRNDVRIYPNPSTGSCSIDLSSLKGGHPMHVEIYRIDGRLVRSVAALEHKQINTRESLAEGVYLLKIISGKTTVTKKLIVR